MTAAEYRATYGKSAPKTPAKPSPRAPNPPPAPDTPAPAEVPTQGRKQMQQQAPELRPRFQVGQYPGYAGKRAVFVGLSEELTEQLRQAARALGIPEQN